MRLDDREQEKRYDHHNDQQDRTAKMPAASCYPRHDVADGDRSQASDKKKGQQVGIHRFSSAIVLSIEPGPSVLETAPGGQEPNANADLLLYHVTARQRPSVGCKRHGPSINLAIGSKRLIEGAGRRSVGDGAK